MADAVTSQTIQDGERKAVLKFTNASDGSGESAVKKVDVSALANNSAGDTCTGVTINKIWWQCTGMSVKIEFDAPSNVLAIGLSEDSNGADSAWDIPGLDPCFEPNPSGPAMPPRRSSSAPNLLPGRKFHPALHGRESHPPTTRQNHKISRSLMIHRLQQSSGTGCGHPPHPQPRRRPQPMTIPAMPREAPQHHQARLLEGWARR